MDPVVHAGRQLRTILQVQAGVALGSALVFHLWLGGEAGRSALAGGGIGFAGSLTYALVAFWSGTRDPEAAWRAQVAAEAGKLVLSAVLFALVFVLYRTLAPLPFFATLMATLLIPYLVVLLKKS